MAGIYIWIELTKVENSEFFADIKKAIERKVFVVPGIEFACDEEIPCTKLRICFTRIDVEKIDEVRSILFGLDLVFNYLYFLLEFKIQAFNFSQN